MGVKYNKKGVNYNGYEPNYNKLGVLKLLKWGIKATNWGNEPDYNKKGAT